MSRGVALLAIVLGVFFRTAVHAQGAAAQEPVVAPLPGVETNITVPSDGKGLMTLHVYSNLIQMPVMVLDMFHEPLRPIPPERFTLRLDDGPPYRPTHVRREGADPISLTILLDAGGARDLMPKIDEAVVRLLPAGLTAHDHVSVFTLDCKLVRTLNDAPAEGPVLHDAVARGLAPLNERRTHKHAPSCEDAVHLWDALALITSRLGELPGRRVIIAVTDGVDSGSKYKWREVTDAMEHRAVTLIGMRPRPDAPYDAGVSNGRRGIPGSASLSNNHEDFFNEMCEESGGLLVPIASWSMRRDFERIPGLLRGRYILEFPADPHRIGGNHIVTVQIAKMTGYIRSSGTSVPLPDPSLMNDPTTIPGDPTRAPQIGKRTVLPPPK